MKVLAGLRRACEKRPVSTEALDQLVDRIERSLVEPGDKEVQSTSIGEQVMEGLRELDEVAYVRFASVYRRFQEATEFVQAVKKLEEES